MNKLDVQKRVLKEGKHLDLNDFNWCEKTNTFSSNIEGLTLDFRDKKYITFNTGDNCTFNTGYNCTFDTTHNCTFDTGYDCTFNTEFNCTFDTGDNCTFKTWGDCTFNTGDNCTFDTGYDCTFNTGYNCTFNTEFNCTFNTWGNCTFKTGDNCTFNTEFNCTFDTEFNCTFDTTHNCTFDTGYDCTFKTWGDCTFNTGYNCTFNTGYDCTFNTGYNCTFNTEFNCTFNTGDNCTFKTWGNCTFKTSSNCTFKTSSNCTFKTSSNCVVIRGDIYDVIELKENTITQLYPYDIKGYSVDGICSETGKKVIVADGILSYIKKQKGNVYKVRNYKEKEISYLIKQGDIYSHGKNLKEAKESLKYKISNRDTSQYEHLTLDSILTKDEAIKMYRVVTGACELGVRSFCENNDIKEELTIRDIIELTKGNFGNGRLKEFIDERCR